jgi:hypothetical protein
MTDDQQWQRRLEALEAKDQIATVMAEYLYQVDRSRDRLVLNGLFSDGAVWEACGNLSEMGVTTSREAIVDMLVALPETLSFTAHFIGNPVIEVASDARTGRGRWHTLELMSKGGDKPAEVVCIAWYDNEFVRQDGRWQISHVRYEDSLVFPFTEGWRDTRYVSLLSGERISQPTPS